MAAHDGTLELIAQPAGGLAATVWIPDAGPGGAAG
ncbi:hypothetical protein FHR81_002583 [Actinoalloteichus hoggarensis]|nr:hypothetical protein [Actinoalloteichus hoggarensis]